MILEHPVDNLSYFTEVYLPRIAIRTYVFELFCFKLFLQLLRLPNKVYDIPIIDVHGYNQLSDILTKLGFIYENV